MYSLLDKAKGPLAKGLTHDVVTYLTCLRRFLRPLSDVLRPLRRWCGRLLRDLVGLNGVRGRVVEGTGV